MRHSKKIRSSVLRYAPRLGAPKQLPFAVGIILTIFATLVFSVRGKSKSLSQASRPSHKVGWVKAVGMEGLRLDTSSHTRRALIAGDSIHLSDRISVGAGMGLHMELNDGSEVRLSENAKLQFERTGAQLILKLLSGNLSLKSKSTLHIQTPKALIKTHSSSLSVALYADSSTEVSLMKGYASVQAEDKSIQLDALDSVMVGEGQPQKALKRPIAIESPEPADVIFSSGGGAEVRLTWSISKPAILNWQVALDAKFETIVAEGKSHDGHAKPKLRPGRYYWRVVDEANLTSHPSHFSLVNTDDIQIEPREPTAQTTVPFVKHLSPIVFDWGAPWSEAMNVTTFVVELSRKQDFQSGLIRLAASDRGKAVLEEGKQIQYRLTMTDPEHLRKLEQNPGKWFWRVSAHFRGVNNPIRSKAMTLSVKQNPVLSAPRLFFPRDQSVESVTEKGIWFSWQHLPEAESYKFYLWRDGELRPFEPSVATRSNFVLVPKTVLSLDGALYHWTVVGSTAASEVGSFSKYQSFRAYDATPLPAPLALEPLHGSQFRVGSEEEFGLSWREVKGAKGYAIEIQRRSAENAWQTIAQRSIASENGQNRMKWLPEGSGSYRWSVEAIDELGRRSARSSWNEFDAMEPARAPAGKADKKLRAPRILSD
ncbi:MAG: FecR family protein [Bdellovibrionota bacterium]